MGTLKRRKCNTQWWKLWERVWVCHRAPYSLLHTLLAFKQCHINYIGHRRKCEIKNVYYIIYSKRWFSNKSVPLDISALHISDLMPVVWLMLHSWMLNSFIAQFNHILSKQVQGTAAWRRCLALTFPPVTPPWSSSCMAHTPLLWAKLDPPRPIFRRKLFFIAP